MKRLIVLLADAVVGHVDQTDGRLSFAYDDGWRESDRIPISLSMPTARREHPHDVVSAYLWGLLPDNERVLARWGREFSVSANNPFALIGAVGEDCPGAIQFVREERRPLLSSGSLDGTQWLDDADVAIRLKRLRGDPAATRISGDDGQFSLAGAQAKTALVYLDGRWGVPSGRVPTTHILKPAHPGFDAFIENEHLSLRLASALSLPTAKSTVRWFDDEPCYVVERYDWFETSRLAAEAAARAAAAAAAAADIDHPSSASRTAALTARAASMAELARTRPLLRLHQEDFCQARAVHPERKYESDGGPSAGDIVTTLRRHSSASQGDIQTFVASLAYNWIIGGTDGHAQNVSLLLADGGQVRLAPLYDIASILPYATIDPRKAKMAMRIGGTYRLSDIGARQWAKFAVAVGLSPDNVLGTISSMLDDLQHAMDMTIDTAIDDGLAEKACEDWRVAILDHAAACKRRLS